MTDYYTGSENAPRIESGRYTRGEYSPAQYKENPMNQPMMASPQYPMQQQMKQHQNLGKQYMYDMSAFDTDAHSILKRALKYLFEGLAVAFVAYYFTKGKLDFKEIVLLGITAAFTFAILDTFSPTVALGTRFGAGFGIGTTMFGLNPAVGGVMASPLI